MDLEDQSYLLKKKDDTFVEFPSGIGGKLRQKKCWIPLTVIALIVVLAGALTVALSVSLGRGGDDDGTPAVWQALQTRGIFVHLNKFEEIAGPFNNSRSVRDGYNASAEYVMSQLQPLHDAGYCTLSRQFFHVPVYRELSRPTLKLPQQQIANNFTLPEFSYQYGVDFAGMRYGGNGAHSVTATVLAINKGCNASDYVGVSGKIALVQEGDCDLPVKAFLAQDANAVAIFIYNKDNRPALLTTRLRKVGWLEGDPVLQLPALALSYSVGSTLKSYGDVQVEFSTNTAVTMELTYNVFCTFNSGKETDVVMIGSHLDSVPEGPGINDNGSGSASILEILLTMRRTGYRPANKIRFAWWGAEEIGLLGSYFYVHTLQTNDTQDYKNLACYLNFDMLGSPNYIPAIHSGSSAPLDVRNQSTVIQSVFEEFFTRHLKKPYGFTPMSGGSDYFPFVQNGIPSGGMAAGAGALKSIEERGEFGGLANAQLDTCYHQPCDTVANINPVALNDMSKAAAYTLTTLAGQSNLRGFLSRSM